VHPGVADQLAFLRERLDPCPQIVGDGHQTPGGCFRLIRPQLDVAAFQIEGRPIESTPISPLSGPIHRPFQEPPAKSKFLAACRT
jgi:hypothetical protein